MSGSDRLIVIGGVAAGLSAASAARRCRPDMDIQVFEKQPYISYSACGIPFAISGQVSSFRDLIVFTPEEFRRQRQIDIATEHEVTEVFTARRVVRVKNLKTGEIRDMPYRFLVFSTGAVPVIPRIAGLKDMQGVFTVRTLNDGLAVSDYLERVPVKKALIAGSGYLGLEMAEAFARRGIETILAEAREQPLAEMDTYIGQSVLDICRKKNIGFMGSARIDGIEGDGIRIRSAVLSGGSRIDTDILILATGIRPNTELAQRSGIELDDRGAIKINRRMETNIPGVYAAGDCAQTYCSILGKPVYVPLGTTANKQGRIAGKNIGGKNVQFKGVTGTSIVTFFDMEISKTGLTETKAREYGFDPVVKAITHHTKAGYFKDAGQLWIKLTADRRTGRLLGAELAGTDAAKRVNIVSAALSARMSVADLTSLDLCYAPPVSPVWDPLLIAANELLKLLE